ncbi:MAG: Gfo/Idh/MocA family protein [Pirellulales bacterium]
MSNQHDGSETAARRSNRRTFLQTASTAAGLAAAAPAFSVLGQEARGANDRIGVGFIGTGGRCQAHMKIVGDLQKAGKAERVAVCDIYGPRLRKAAELTGGTPYRNYQELLADPKVDAVCIATPDRHHAPQAIDAVRAGKDVYVEKPLVHWSQFSLARKLAEEAERHGRIVQVGTQYVADDAYVDIRRRIEEGVVGKIVHVQTGFFRRGDWGERMPIPDPQAQPGKDLDWKQFLGDAPEVPFSVSRFFQWRLYWDYAGGPATDLLVHAFTPVFCLLDLDFPERVLGGGGNFQYDREVPDQCNIIADYPGGPSVVMTNSLSNFTGIDTMLRGTDGIIIWKGVGHKENKGARIVPAAKGAKEIFIPWRGMGQTSRLWENFIDCIHSRKKPYSPVDLAVRVQAPLNMGILSHRESRVARFDTAAEKIVI